MSINSNGQDADGPMTDSSASRMDPTPDPALDRTPDPAIVFAILHATSKAVESTRRIKEAEDGGEGDTNGTLFLHWFDLGRWVWRLNRLFDSICEPEGDIAVAAWADDADPGLCDLCNKFYDAFNDANDIASAFGGELSAVLEHCCGKKGTFPESHFITVLRPFQRAFEPAVDERDEMLSGLTRDVWNEWMPTPWEDNPDSERLLQKLFDGSLLAEMKRDRESATNGRASEALAPATPADHFELVAAAPSENGTAATEAATNAQSPKPRLNCPTL